ncbi:MAG: single-stranded DNA-binding protein [Spirochaetaceae bacterium]|nr:single-stranded DNA-binding protein [Spirochaetaceae bacterium]
MNETVITVVGNVAREPNLRVTTNGTRVVSFRLASTERRYDRALGGWRDGETIFYTVTCWRNVAENLMDSVEKGQPMVVHGRLRDGTYEKDGQRHAVFEIEAYALGHDISRGVSKFTKASVSGGRSEPPNDDGERSGLSAVRPPTEDAEAGDDSLSPSAA